LGARDTLRTEACYPLYGHELDDHTTPLEAGLGVFVAWDKGEFVGRAALAVQKERGVGKRCVAFKMAERCAPPRPGYPIWTAGSAARAIGVTVSGTQSPSLGVGIGLGYVPPEFATPGASLDIENPRPAFPRRRRQKAALPEAVVVAPNPRVACADRRRAADHRDLIGQADVAEGGFGSTRRRRAGREMSELLSSRLGWVRPGFLSRGSRGSR